MEETKKEKKGKKVFFVFLVLIVLFIVIVAIASNSDSSSSDGSTTTATQKNEETTQDPDTYIDMDEYNKIKVGMTYKEVVKIIGCEGKVSSSADFSDGSVVNYGWSSKNMGGDEYGGTVTYGATISFVDGKVTSKMQIGLDLVDDVNNAIKSVYGK